MSIYDIIPPLNAAAVLKRYGLRADKSLGQNFLQDPFALEKIADAAEITPGDSALEIGPGLGSLTRYLAVSAQQVTAVELDADLLPPLKAILKPHANVRLIHGDILKLSPSELMEQPDYIVAANIPYYITSAIIRHLLEHEPKPRRMVLTIQKEVANRICAAPGDLSLLALSVQVYGEPAITGLIPAEAFYPAPKVDSAILRLDIYKAPLIPHEQLAIFFKLIKAGFSQKRKTLRNSLSGGLHIPTTEAESMLKQTGIDPQRRAETLSIPEWQTLCNTHQKTAREISRAVKIIS
ncbi:MAG: 16S rRNA (adenine(1518)-N(6)/adenine(1519)-N(6))-dimethyltransferase RsmA [Anaerolineales bacterium]|nr:16S rRNA (adenine(1518)-N(6)/adenine(1519)-N(6))-dimethyltransferase RsmA [Anaerolineales bacterium]